MRKKITISLFVLLIFQVSIWGQLTYTEYTDIRLKLDVSEVIKSLEENTSFGELPSYRAFVIYGDGNYERFSDTTINTLFQFEHDYLYKSDYQGLLLLQERKTDTPPPENDQSLFPTFQGISPGIIRVNNGDDIPTDSPLVNLKDDDRLITSFSERIVMDYSHHDGLNKYYLESNKYVAFPIAYRSTIDNKEDLIVFYFDDDLNKQAEFNSYQAYTPNYLGLTNSLVNPLESDVSNIPFFEQMSTYRIPVANERLRNMNNPGIPPELRWFPIIQSKELSHRNYRFLAVLYGGQTNEIGNNNYTAKSDILGPNTNIPFNFYTQSEGSGTPVINDTFYFNDAYLFEVFQSEPVDPNKLVITQIAKVNPRQSIIQFKLEFCNDAEFGAASGATVVLDYDPQFLSDIQVDNVQPNSDFSTDLIQSKCCNQTFNNISSKKEDLRWCIRIKDEKDYLIGLNQRCATMNFSARINTDQLNLLHKQSIIQYCVFLQSTWCDEFTNDEAEQRTPAAIDLRFAEYLSDHPNNTNNIQYEALAPSFKHGEVCGVNCILDRMELKDTTINGVSRAGLIPNPIWAKRNETCINCRNCFDYFVFNQLNQCLLVLSFIAIFCMSFWFNKHRYHKKATKNQHHV